MSSAAAAAGKKRVRRQKQFIAVGGVCLLAILGYQLPKLLGGHSGQTAAPATTASASLAVASPDAVSGALPDTDRVPIARDTSQLLSFGLFKSKDPFVQQLSTTPAPVAATPSASAASKVGSATPNPATGAPAASGTAAPTSVLPSAPSVIVAPATPQTPAAPVAPTTTPVSPTPATPPSTGPAAASTSALISTNGVCQQVVVKGTFPANEDIFRLVEIAQDGKSVKIAIVGGSYDSGQPTATLKLAQKLTLVNTSDGSRYVIVFEAKCAVVSPGTTGTTATTPAAPSPIPPTPTPTPTTPIVTDALDPTPAPSS